VHGFLVMGGVIAAAGHAIQRIGQTLRMQFGTTRRLRP
jgi:hypothetical protein